MTASWAYSRARPFGYAFLEPISPLRMPRDGVDLLYETARVRWPGMLTRTRLWWKHRFDDPKAGREGFSSLRCVLHETEGVPDGYAIYRQKSNWDAGFPNGKILVREALDDLRRVSETYLRPELASTAVITSPAQLDSTRDLREALSLSVEEL